MKQCIDRFCIILLLYNVIKEILFTECNETIYNEYFLSNYYHVMLWLSVLLHVRWSSFQRISAAVPVLPSSVSDGTVWGRNWVPGSNGLAALLCCSCCSRSEWDEIAAFAHQHTCTITYAVFSPYLKYPCTFVSVNQWHYWLTSFWTAPPHLHLTTSQVMVIVWRLRGILSELIYILPMCYLFNGHS